MIKKNSKFNNLKSAIILTPGVFLLFFWIAVFSSGDILQLLGITKSILFSALAAYGLSLSITIFIKTVLNVDAKE